MEEDQIHLSNLQDEDVVPHSIFLLKGYISNIKTSKSLQIYVNQKLQLFRQTEFFDSSTQTLHFKCIVELKRNKNYLVVEYNNDRSKSNHTSQKLSSQCTSEILNPAFNSSQTKCGAIQSSHDFCQNCSRNHKSRRTSTHACQEHSNISQILLNINANLKNNNLNTQTYNCEQNCIGCNLEHSNVFFEHNRMRTNENDKYYQTRTEDVFETNIQESNISNNLNANLCILSTALDKMNMKNFPIDNFNETIYNVTTQDCELPNNKCFTLYYIPRSTPLVVTPVYIVPQNHDGRFQTLDGHDNSIQNACKKIVLGVKLIQCLMAMLLRGGKTFQMEYEEPDNNDTTLSEKSHYINKCLVFHSALTVDQVNNATQEQMWEYFGRELMMSGYGSPNKKFVAFLSCTRWTGERVLAHAAIGGGGLALFGTGCLHTWPSHVDQIVDCFLNSVPVNTELVMDDSCNRSTYGGCYSTTLGSVCHEMGHTFDLGHSRNGIMGRGFDSIDCLFVFRPTKTTTRETIVANESGAASEREGNPRAQHKTRETTKGKIILVSDRKKDVIAQQTQETTKVNILQSVNINDGVKDNTNINTKKDVIAQHTSETTEVNILQSVNINDSVNDSTNKNIDTKLSNIIDSNQNNKNQNTNVFNNNINNSQSKNTNTSSNTNSKTNNTSRNVNKNSSNVKNNFNENINNNNFNSFNKNNINTSMNKNCPLVQHKKFSPNDNIINVDFVPHSANRLKPFENRIERRSHSSERIKGLDENYGFDTRTKSEMNGEINKQNGDMIAKNTIENSTNHSLVRRNKSQHFIGRNHSSLERNHLKRSISRERNSSCEMEYGARIVLCAGRRGSEAERESKDRSVNSSEVQCSMRNEEEIFWSENCAVMLNYHRWFNSYGDEQNTGDSQTSNLKFDARRNTVTSSAGLRLVELRGSQALCLRHWSFTWAPGAQPRRCFILPVQYLRTAHALVAIDSYGSIVKTELR